MTDQPVTDDVARSRLTGTRLQVPADPTEFYELSLAEGFGDGLPLIQPTQDRVLALLEATPYGPEHVLGTLAPQLVDLTVERTAVNAAMAGCAPAAFPYVVAALEGVLEPDFLWPSLAATSGSVTPMLIVNGPRRAELGFDMDVGCMGGAAGRGSGTVGRAVELVLRNVGGQRVGVTSKSVFGQPARMSGLCFAEWEEVSPWPSFAVQRGFDADDEVVTVHSGSGTFPFTDMQNDDPRELLMLVAKTIAYPLSTLYLALEASFTAGDPVLAINPVWAQQFGREFPDIEDVLAFLWEHAWQPIEAWPVGRRGVLEALGRVDDQGRVRLAQRPDQFSLLVCGGRASLHAVLLPCWGSAQLQSVKIARA